MDFDQGHVEGCQLDANFALVGIPHSPYYVEGAFILAFRGAGQRKLYHLHFGVFFCHALGQLYLLSGKKIPLPRMWCLILVELRIHAPHLEFEGTP